MKIQTRIAAKYIGCALVSYILVRLLQSFALSNSITTKSSPAIMGGIFASMLLLAVNDAYRKGCEKSEQTKE